MSKEIFLILLLHFRLNFRHLTRLCKLYWKKIKCEILKEGNRGNIKVVMMIEMQEEKKSETLWTYQVNWKWTNFLCVDRGSRKELRHYFYDIFYYMKLHKASVSIYWLFPLHQFMLFIFDATNFFFFVNHESWNFLSWFILHAN